MLTNKQLLGWYGYSWAAEPFIVCAVGTYVPILLEQFARQNGVWVKDYITPCNEIGNNPPGNGDPDGHLPPFPGTPSSAKCMVKFFGRYIDTSSLPLYTFSASVFVQTLVVISMSGAADRGRYRKKLLIIFAIVGSICTCTFLFVTSKHYYLACLLAVISNAAFGAVSVCGNAFLPILVNQIYENNNMSLESESLLSASSSSPPLIEEASPLIPNHSKSNPSEEEKGTVSSQISGKGVAIGYFAALLVQLATMVLIVVVNDYESSSSAPSSVSTFAVRLAIFVVGLWWLVFQIPIAMFLKSSSEEDGHHHKYNVHQLIFYGWKTVYSAFKQARQMRDVCGFLLGWFIVSDAATTINSAAILFARVELQMSAPHLAIIGILVVCSGILGATITPKIRFSGSSNQSVDSIIFVIAVAAVIPLYGMLGFYVKSIGLKHQWEMYALGIWYGFALGGLNATCRSVFSLLIPKGQETTFFSLFSVTDKGSSIVGPLITGYITDKTHNIRYTFYFLFIMMVLAALSFYKFVDIDRGAQEAQYLQHVVGDEEEPQVDNTT